MDKFHLPQILQQLIAWVGSGKGNPPCPPLCPSIRRLLSGEQLARSGPLSELTHSIYSPGQEEMERLEDAEDIRAVLIIFIAGQDITFILHIYYKERHTVCVILLKKGYSYFQFE